MEDGIEEKQAPICDSFLIDDDAEWKGKANHQVCTYYKYDYVNLVYSIHNWGLIIDAWRDNFLVFLCPNRWNEQLLVT